MVQDIARGLTTSNLVAYGLPSVIAQVIVPKLVTFCQRYPRGAKILTYLAAFLSVCGTFSFGIKPIFEKFVWSWLPRVQLQSDDLLYQHLRKFIEAKSYPTTPHVLRGSAKNNGTASGGELDDGRDCSDAHKAKKKQSSRSRLKNHIQESQLSSLFPQWDSIRTGSACGYRYITTSFSVQCH